MQKKLLLTITLASIIIMGCTNEEAKPKTSKFERFQSVDTKKTTMLQSGKEKHSCPLCGMKLPMFYKTNHAATSNGTTKQYCSIHCLVDDKTNNKNSMTEMKVVAIDTLNFIDVKDATYVVGSKIPGTMTSLSKYAFEGRMSARRFAKENQGSIMRFDEAYGYALKDFR